MIPRHRLRGLARFLYTQNPFYAISAGLILYGIYVAFRADDARIDDPWLLALSLCGYTLLMAVTAFLVIRLGRLWDDARSIVLILLLQFAAISMSFDGICAVSCKTALGLLLFGFAFAAAITEGLLFSLGIKLPALYRGPYYLILGLLFFYALWLSPEGGRTSVNAFSWRIYLFPTCAGLAFLTLFPAVRRGRVYAAKNGTPWPWPWFPGTAFALLAVAVGARSWVLTYNFNMIAIQNAFGMYYLAPFVLAILVLLVEFALTEHRRRMQKTLMCLAPVLLVMSIPAGSNQVYLRFLALFVETVGSPIWLALVALVLFYGYCWLREIREAEMGLVATFLLASLVGRQTVDWATLGDLQWWPLASMAALQGAMSMRTGSSLRCVVATGAAVAAMSIGLRDTWFVAMYGVLPVHLTLGAALVISAVFGDRLAGVLRHACLALITAAVLAATLPWNVPPATDADRLVYAALMTLLVFLCWRTWADRWWFYGGVVNAGATSALAGWTSYATLERQVGSRALAPLSWGLACFLIAALISAAKAGLWDHVRKRLIELQVLRR